MPEHPTDAHFSFTFVFKQALKGPVAAPLSSFECIYHNDTTADDWLFSLRC